MNSSFKQYYNLASVKSLAHRCSHIIPKFRTDNFIKETAMGLEALQMKDRVRQIASILHKYLDPHYPRAVEQIKQVAGVDSDLELIRHRCRTLIKQGHPGVFEVLINGKPYGQQAFILTVV